MSYMRQMGEYVSTQTSIIHQWAGPSQLIFLRKSDCLGCAVLLCFVCLFDLACSFLSSFLFISHLSLKHVDVHVAPEGVLNTLSMLITFLSNHPLW